MPDPEETEREAIDQAWQEYMAEHGYATYPISPDTGADFAAGFLAARRLSESGGVDPFPIYCFRDDIKHAWGHKHEGDKFSPDPEFSQNVEDYVHISAGSIARPQKHGAEYYGITALSESDPTVHPELRVGLSESEIRRDQAERAVALISELVDPDPCRWDHNHSCQAHGYFYIPQGEMCPVQEGKDFVAQFTSPETEQETE